MIETTLQDLRYVLRGLRRSPVFTVTALVTLALATGAVSTVLSLANAMLWRPVAPSASKDLVVVAAVRRAPTIARERVSFVDYAHIRNHTTTLRLAAQVTGFAPLWVSYGSGGGKELVGAAVSASYFTVLDLKPALGRFFVEDEDGVPDRDPVVVLSHRLWREGWGANAAALGAVVKIYGVPFTVIGVVPEGFEGLVPQRSDVYIPTMMLRVLNTGCDPIADQDCETLHMVGRPRDRRTLDEVKAEIPTLAPQRWKTNPTPNEAPRELTAVPLLGAWAAHGELGFADWENGLSLSLIAGVCLLLGCVNLGGLMLARGSSRVRDMALRAAVGATPLRLLRQLMTESVLLAVSGGALGLCLSMGLTRLFLAHFHEAEGLHYNANPDALVIVSAAAASVVAGLLFGILPALKSLRLGAALTLYQQTSASVARPRITRWLIGAQVALAQALVTLVVLLGSSTERFISEAHFDPSRLALFRLTPGFGASGRKYSSERAEAFHREVLDRLKALPGVLSVSLYSGSGGSVLSGAPATISTDRPAASRRSERGGWKAIAPGFFSVLGTPLLRGRDFDARDSLHSPRVAIVNQSLARLFWPDGNPIGSPLIVNKGSSTEVIGVVADVSAPRWGALSVPEVYLPFWQVRDVNARYCVRVVDSPAAAVPMLTSAVSSIDPDVPLREAMSMTARLAQQELREIRMIASVASYGAALAVLLSAIGLYGTLAFTVVSRTKEFGIRIAVGASQRDVIGLILSEEMRVVMSGVLAGVGLAWSAARLFRHLLYGAAENDLIYALAAVGLTAVGLLACSVPARRAAGLDPTTALRAD